MNILQDRLPEYRSFDVEVDHLEVVRFNRLIKCRLVSLEPLNKTECNLTYHDLTGGKTRIYKIDTYIGEDFFNRVGTENTVVLAEAIFRKFGVDLPKIVGFVPYTDDVENLLSQDPNILKPEVERTGPLLLFE